MLAVDQRCPGQYPRRSGRTDKGDQNALTTAEQQVSEYGPPTLVNAGDLAIEDGAIDSEMLCDPASEIGDVAKNISISGDQLPLARVEMGKCRNPSIFSSKMW